MVRIIWRSWWKRALAPLIWLLGLVLIVHYAPANYHILQLGDGEQVVAFLGKSHELVTVDGGPPPKHRGGPWNGSPKPVKHLPPGVGNGLRGVELVPRGDSIYLWDLDHAIKRKLNLLEPVTIYGIAPCASGERLCIEAGSGPSKIPVALRFSLAEPDTGRVTILDAHNGKVIRSVDWIMHYESSISDDGRILAYHGFPLRTDRRRIICLEVVTGQPLYTIDGVQSLLAPNGKLLAITKPGGGSEVIDFDQDRRLSPPKIPQQKSLPAFSPRSDMFIDEGGKVWDIGTNHMICDTARPCIFVNGGKQIAWIEPLGNDLQIRWRDLETLRELAGRHIRIPGAWGIIESADTEGNLIHACGWHWQLPGIGNWLPRWLAVFFFRAGDTKLHHAWLLIDGRSGTILHQGTDELQAVSSDGQYAVSGEHEPSQVKVYKLPVRKSLLIMVTAAAAWTMVVVVATMLGRCRRRRRVKPVIAT